jgi:hypothetical protein
MHGLINYPDAKAFVGFSYKLTCRKIFRHQFAVLADEIIFICRQGVAEDTEIAAKVSDGKRSLSIIHVHCRLYR